MRDERGCCGEGSTRREEGLEFQRGVEMKIYWTLTHWLPTDGRSRQCVPAQWQEVLLRGLGIYAVIYNLPCSQQESHIINNLCSSQVKL